MTVGRRSLQTALLAAALWLCVDRAAAQTVSPAVVKFTEAAEGSFDITNDGLVPLIATVEARSFTIDEEGTAAFDRLSPATHVELSQTSVRVPPKQRRTIYYRASAASYPAWFTIYSNLSGLPRRNGMNVMLSLPHTVYLLSKQPVTRNDVRLSDVRLAGSAVQAMVQNESDKVVRVLEVEATHGRSSSKVGGFPLLPHGRRLVRLEVPVDSRVTRIRVRTETLVIDQAVP